MAHVVSIAFDVDSKSYLCLYRSLWSYPWDLTVGREICYMQLHNASICTLCIVNHRLHQQMPSCPPFLYAHFSMHYLFDILVNPNALLMIFQSHFTIKAVFSDGVSVLMIEAARLSTRKNVDYQVTPGRIVIPTPTKKSVNWSFNPARSLDR